MKHELTIPSKHGLHNLVSTKRTPRLPPVLGAHLDDEDGHADPEEDVEAVELAVRGILVLSIEAGELLRKDHVPQLLAPARQHLLSLLDAEQC